MKKKMSFTLIFAGIACLILALIQELEAQQPIFFADFDAKGIPNNTVNDPKNWKPENPANTWGIADFAANGTKALQMTGGGCGSSGFTPFPTVKDWANGVIQVHLGWNDDDSWGIMFRRKDERTGYFAFFGYMETLSLALFDLAQGCGLNGKCLNETGCEEGPDGNAFAVEKKALKALPHNLGKLVKDGALTSFTARILADGPTIKIWYGRTADFPKDPLQEPQKFASIIEVTDKTYQKGSVGIWQESNDKSVIDNVYVFDESGLAVAPQDKLATIWGRLKIQ